LLLAADYPFNKIIGVELLPELHAVAQANIAKRTDRERFELVRMDAREYGFPAAPSVIYLFNPLHEAGLTRLVENLSQSLQENPRELWIIYHNPLLTHVIVSGPFERTSGTHQYLIYKVRS
jgi:hypothetical protein